MLILDRIEGEYAYLASDDGMLRIARSLLATDAAEGDVVVLTDGLYHKDAKATAVRRERIRGLLRKRIKD